MPDKGKSYQRPDRKFVILGGGPAGLTAAYQLCHRGYKPVVFEKLDKVGGISRTEQFNGYYFDMGGHRFFTKSKEVEKMWHEVLKDDFLLRPRLSRIYYNQKFFDYPLKPANALKGLGLWQSMLVGLSYFRWQLFPSKEEDTFEQWVTNRFGSRLFNTFFKSYTEKVWGIPTSELSAEWAAQRIKGLSLKTAVLNMFITPKETIKTLIEEFHYPKRGPGMMWNEVKHRVEDCGGSICLNHEVVRILRDGNRIEKVVIDDQGEESEGAGSDFISSLAITELIFRMDPPPPDIVVSAAKQLRHRDFLTVCLIVNRKDLFDDNWIYVHDPEVEVGRIQNYKNWSPFMVPEENKSSLGLEYFCNEGDELWSMSDEKLVELGKAEIEKVGLAKSSEVIGGSVFRVEKSYPVYDSNYSEHLSVIRAFVDDLENFQTIGRNGLHRYNNQDHAMLTGMLAVRNLLDGENHDLWQVNAEQEYHEEVKPEEESLAEVVVDEAFARAFMRIDPVATGLSLGLVLGGVLFLLSLVVSINQVESLVYYFYLLGQFFPGYDVTTTGSLLLFLYGFAAGFVLGWSLISIRNTIIRLYISIIRRRAEIRLLEDYGFFPDEQSQSTYKKSQTGEERKGKL
jgi:protoporphyrinogen oxidase